MAELHARATATATAPVRDAAAMLARTLAEWGGRTDPWIFGYASLIWRPDFDFIEQRPARVQGWHRALKMWSRVNRGTPECPGLVFALLSGGSCRGVAFRVRRRDAVDVLATLWQREMPSAVYDPRWLACQTPQGEVRALAFTLSRRSPSFTGNLTPTQYQDIFVRSHGRYGSTQDYARQTLHSLRAQGIHDHALQRLLALAEGGAPSPR